MADIVKVYNYDSEGNITATGTMDLDIFETVPMDATIVQPPKQESELAPNETLRFNEIADEWVIEIDETYEEPTEDPDYVSDTQRIEELEMTLADLMAGGM